MTTTSFFHRHQLLIIIVLSLLGAIVLGLFIASQRLEAYVATVSEQQSNQSARLIAMADLLARNAVDEAGQALVQDCPVNERVRFDDLLGRLDQGLTSAELQEVDGLFASCASYQADRKALMVARFTREVEAYAETEALLATLITSDSTTKENLNKWEQLLTLEQKQSASLNALVVAQQEIITTLISGKASDSPEMTAILDGVRETQEALLFAGTQATTLRGELTDM